MPEFKDGDVVYSVGSDEYYRHHGRLDKPCSIERHTVDTRSWSAGTVREDRVCLVFEAMPRSDVFRTKAEALVEAIRRNEALQSDLALEIGRLKDMLAAETAEAKGRR
jgi:hypothetical protein